MSSSAPVDTAQGAQKDEDHLEETLRSVVRLRAEHLERATFSQRLIARAAERLGRPRAPLVLAGLLAVWICGNFALAAFGLWSFDPPPFMVMQCTLNVASVFALVLILAAQTHEDQLNRQRDLLELELALLVERKTTKVIQLLEELRRDLPLVHDRHDAAAHRMSTPADAQAVLEMIREQLFSAEAGIPHKVAEVEGQTA